MLYTTAQFFPFRTLEVVKPASSPDLFWVAGRSSLASFTRPAWLGHVRHSDMHPISDTLPWYTNPTSPLSPQDNSREEKWSDRQLVHTLVPAGHSRAMARPRGRPELKVGYWVGKEKGCHFLDQGT